jgi:SAM-dependent methyltransferase
MLKILIPGIKLTKPSVAAKVSSFWSKKTAEQQTGPRLKLRWWQSANILRHINMTVCGEAIDGPSAGLIRRAFETLGDRQPFELGVSVGGGNGLKEMMVLESGLVQHFKLYELSTARIQDGRKLAKRRGLEDRIEFIEGDAFDLLTAIDSVDFVHWNNALHHMLNVPDAIHWSRTILRPGGMFYMDDFIGADRFQWSDTILDICESIRKALPEKYLINPFEPNKLISYRVPRPRYGAMIEADPSEAPDSSRTLQYVKHFFPDAEITLTGGVIYHLALKDIINNFDEDNDREQLALLLAMDDIITSQGNSLYATALAFK